MRTSAASESSTTIRILSPSVFKCELFKLSVHIRGVHFRALGKENLKNFVDFSSVAG